MTRSSVGATSPPKQDDYDNDLRQIRIWGNPGDGMRLLGRALEQQGTLYELRPGRQALVGLVKWRAGAVEPIAWQDSTRSRLWTDERRQRWQGEVETAIAEWLAVQDA